jgi:hypothetical protein
MKDQDNQNREFTTNRSGAGEGAADMEERDDASQQPEGAKYKGNPQKTGGGSHQEGQYDKQSDNDTMRPSSIDED